MCMICSIAMLVLPLRTSLCFSRKCHHPIDLRSHLLAQLRSIYGCFIFSVVLIAEKCRYASSAIAALFSSGAFVVFRRSTSTT
mmetsp:Transcript_13306/g.28194  ORF Transcript_13306/g.28194 Transcript_13306/m.28194 type:complete len:83 (+) Transcript_13306:2388-2636(+)